MGIRASFGENLPGLGLQRTRDALARMVELRWPYGRRKAVRLNALARSLGALALWIVIGLLMLIVFPAHLIAGVGLGLIDRLKAKADELWGRG